MTILSVNINKFATLRNARGHNLPNLNTVVADLLSYGVKSITLHPRPDQRHITRQDVYDISEQLKLHNELSSTSTKVEYNIEGYPSEDFLHLIKDIQPTQCTLVPDPPEAITSNAGWDVSTNLEFLKEVVAKIKSYGSRVSLFMDPQDVSSATIEKLHQINAERIELYTEDFAKAFGTDEEQIILTRYKEAAQLFVQNRIEINAGHDLNQKNLSALISTIPEIEEVSIGHALVCEALYQGLEKTVGSYHSILSAQ